LPVFLIVVAGTAHLGRLVFARHQVANATDVATRMAVVTHVETPGDVQILVENELKKDSPCDDIIVDPQFVGVAGTGMTRLEVKTTCLLAPLFGGELFSFLGPSSVSATSVVPF